MTMQSGHQRSGGSIRGSIKSGQVDMRETDFNNMKKLWMSFCDHCYCCVMEHDVSIIKQQQLFYGNYTGHTAFSALTLLVQHQEEHPACKN